jgi:carbon monoxide dehydrogenase subunit G
MDIAGNYTFDAPQQLVWDALLDPNVLGSVMPGGKGFEQTGENQYGGVLEVKVGPVQGTFQGQIKLSDIVAPEHYQIQVDGKGAAGFVKANGQLQLEARDQQTHMEYSGNAQVGGRIASVGQRLMDSAARSIIRQSLDGLNEYLKIEVAKQAPPPVVQAEVLTPDVHEAPAESHTPAAAVAATTYKPPSQTALGIQVARDVVGELIPAQYQAPLLVSAVIVIVMLIIWAWAT